jgi:PAS domain S-box-containing protein
MSKYKAKTEEMAELRRKAEAQLKKKVVRLREQSGGDPERVLAELQVHQIELEMQNEALRRVHYELEESRQKYSDLYDFAPIGYFTFDTHGHVTEANLTGCQMLGVEKKNLIKKPFYLFVDKDSQNAFYLHRRAALNPGLRQTCEITLVRKDGEKFEARLDSITVLNNDEHVIGSRVAVIDITERKRAEEALGESEERYRTFFEHSLDAVLLSAPDGRIEAANAAACQMFRMSADELRKAGRSGIVDKSDPQIARFLEERAQAGQFRGELNFIRKDGTVFPGEISSALFTGAGDSARTAMIIRDVTERKKAEEALRQSEEKFHGLFTTMSEAFILFELIRNDAGKVVDCRMLDANPALEEMTGLRPADIIGRTIMEVFPKTDKFWFDAYGKVETTGKPESIERLYKPLDRFYYTSIYKPAPGRVAVVFTDVTERKKAEKAMYQEKESYRTLAENLPGLVYRIHLGEQHRMEFFNQSLVELTGYTQAELTMGEVCSIDPLILAEDHNSVVEAVQRAIRKHQPFVIEYRLRTKAGEVRHFAERGKPIYAPDGTCMHLDGVIFDITKRKKAEQALRRSEQRLRLAQTSAGAGVWDWDIATGKLEWSEELFDLFGLDPTKHEASFETWRSILHPDDKRIAEERIERTIKSHAPHKSEYRIVLESGRVRWISSLGDTIYDDQGKPQRMSGICLDVTERKKAEQAMRREAQILAQVHDCVVTTDLQGNITLWNRGAERVFGYSADEALGQNISLVYFDKDLPILSDAIIAPMLERSENELEVRCRHKSGREVFLHLSLSVLRDENGSPIELIGYSLDITERKKAEEALRQSNEELNRFNRAAVGRELRMIELKKEVNELYAQTGRPPQYSLEFLNNE